MMRVEDRARADLALTPERTYYRFATDSSIEDGDLPAIADFETAATALLEAVKGADDEKPLTGDMKVQIFVNNRLDNSLITEQSLRRLVSSLEPHAAEFAFLRGFLA